MKRPPLGPASDDDTAHHRLAPTSPTTSTPEHGETKIDYLTADNPRGRAGSGAEARGRRRSHESTARTTASSLSRSPSAKQHIQQQRTQLHAHDKESTKQTAEKQPQQPASSGGGDMERRALLQLLGKDSADDTMEGYSRRRWRLRNPWSWSALTVVTTALSALLIYIMADSFMHRQRDQPGCRVPMMYPTYAEFKDFDTEHTRFATKYHLYLYREGNINKDAKVRGVPVLFIPGNAGSHKQCRSLGAEAAYYYQDLQADQGNDIAGEKLSLDLFCADFNEDITAFHGQTLLDQAEYLNDAIAYILSLYHNPHRSARDSDLPDPSSIILIGHSMGGIVARTMLTMPNYQPNTVNTIITLSAPHARPPVSFDADIVRTYQTINDYWREAYSQKWANDNPLWHVTLISIAGGGLDTVVPSDYASVASLVPDTHGFTVFTSTIPTVWTGMDHLAITWCDQLRKQVIRAIMETVDVSRPVQTRPRAQRMRTFKKWFLTGMEDIAEKSLSYTDAETFLILQENSNSIVPQGERLTLRQLGPHRQPKAHFMPIPPTGSPGSRKFTLMTDQLITDPQTAGTLEVLFCSVSPHHGAHPPLISDEEMDLSKDKTGATRLACKTASSDVITLPASRADSVWPSDPSEPFSYLQYDLDELHEHQFVAIVDKATHSTKGFVIAEFSSDAESTVLAPLGLSRLLAAGLHTKLPASRPLVVDVKVPALHSSLLAYNLRVRRESQCDGTELFTPLLRQYISDVHETKFFVNLEQDGVTDISLHGVAPYLPPVFKKQGVDEGLSIQVWTDPTCQSALDVSLKVDVVGSVGKLWMRYRTLFAAFPLIVVALVFRKQFKIYDETGIFMSFSESMNQCLRTSLPVLYLALTFLAISLAKSSHRASKAADELRFSAPGNATEGFIDYSKNGLLLGSQDTFFWFLVPFFGLLCSGVCIFVNYLALGLTHLFLLLFSLVRFGRSRGDERRQPAPFANISPRQRILTTSVLLLLVSTIIPYQFAYLVLCMVQWVTCTRALKAAREHRSETSYNFYNYAHSLLVLMLWVLPINMPTLVVWVRNLAVHWLTPFSSHHNILSITPYILLVETISTGRMIPRVTTRIRYFTNILLFAIAVYAGVYGVTYAYLLHQLVNILCAWLVSIHFSSTSFSLSRLNRLIDGNEADGHIKKRP